MKLAMINVDRALVKAGVQSRILLQVHDELVLEVVKSELEQVKAIVVHEMTNASRLNVPLEVNLGVGKSWGEAAH